ncbi:hypothetical protein TRIUR3_15152 [Triticum urartu]|uniref:Protein PHLOEM PROTEIN 2-LIKE A10 n=1 Tax=Triticum urartu TaxID=4572 RepID=M7ZQ49_TRIUA|nr:hypothetical protein TRIUR3_15152 [Triticum urartu]
MSTSRVTVIGVVNKRFKTDFSHPTPRDRDRRRFLLSAIRIEQIFRAIRSWVEVFTATAVGVFIDKTIHINTYDQICAAATNPAYDSKLQKLLVAVCSASVETLVKTSHGVLSNGNGNAHSGNGEVGEGWTETVSSALAVPSNRKLVLDLTGRAILEAVRSFLEFVLWRLHDAARAGGDATARAGLCALRYMSERSMVVAAICIVLCLHVLNRTWLLAPA